MNNNSINDWDIMSQNPDNDITVDTSELFAPLWALFLIIIIISCLTEKE